MPPRKQMQRCKVSSFLEEIADSRVGLPRACISTATSQRGRHAQAHTAGWGVELHASGARGGGSDRFEQGARGRCRTGRVRREPSSVPGDRRRPRIARGISRLTADRAESRLFEGCCSGQGDCQGLSTQPHAPAGNRVPHACACVCRAAVHCPLKRKLNYPGTHSCCLRRAKVPRSLRLRNG